MNAANPKTMTIETVERQRRYVADQQKKGDGLGVVFADAFLRGMRDIGYKSPAWALAEMIDNAIQAAAQRISIRFGYHSSNKNKKKPDMVAICDDGNGMIPDMISYAVRWGGTDREDDRRGFGRYGYGLPSAAVSLAKKYTVYSKPADGDWHAVTVDIDGLAEVAGDLGKTDALLSPKPAKLPLWLLAGENEFDLKNMNSGTVVVLEELDRLSVMTGWIKSDTLRTKFLQHFGLIYRYWLPERKIYVGSVQAQVVDPLFLMEHGRFFDETSVRAIRVEARTFDVETSRGTTGTVRIRASVMPPNFQLAEPSDFGKKGARRNKRFPIMKDYNGLIVCRDQRQVDCVSPRFASFQNNDRYIKIEIDFDPELDEYFGITTSKQQIVIADEMWEKLQHDGKGGGDLVGLVNDLRKRLGEFKDQLNAEAKNSNDKTRPRPSAISMEETEKFKGPVPEPSNDQKAEADRNISDLADETSRKTGRPKKDVVHALKEETANRRWEVEFSAIPEGPFYLPRRLGEQKRVIINTEHPFYTKIYDTNEGVQAALEILLFVYAERELEVQDDAAIFYKAERQKWSERLRHALDHLIPDDDDLVNKVAVFAEAIHTPQ